MIKYHVEWFYEATKSWILLSGHHFRWCAIRALRKKFLPGAANKWRLLKYGEVLFTLEITKVNNERE